MQRLAEFRSKYEKWQASAANPATASTLRAELDKEAQGLREELDRQTVNMKQSLAGLEAIHRAGIVHRDISPENLMITRESDGRDTVKIIDLGVAKSEDSDTGTMTKTGIFVGKLRYCSPEHLGFITEGQRIDGRADLYSLAIVFVEILTGRPPFEATSPHQYILHHSRDTELQPVDLGNVPAGLQPAIARALERDRNKRFANAREFAEALQGAAAAIPDENAMKTMMLPNDADETIRPGTQSPFAATVRLIRPRARLAAKISARSCAMTASIPTRLVFASKAPARA